MAGHIVTGNLKIIIFSRFRSNIDLQPTLTLINFGKQLSVLQIVVRVSVSKLFKN